MSEEKPIAIAVTPTRWDFFYGGVLAFYENYKWPYRIAIGLSLPFAIIAFAMHFIGAPPEQRLALYGFDWFIVMPLLIYFFPHWFFYLVTGGVVRANPRLTEQVQIQYSTQGVSVKSATGRSELNWSIYHHVTETPDYFLMYTAKRTAGALPKRAFSSQDDLEAFRNLVRHAVKGPVKLLG